jgi:hypothetical protein
LPLPDLFIALPGFGIGLLIALPGFALGGLGIGFALLGFTKPGIVSTLFGLTKPFIFVPGFGIGLRTALPAFILIGLAIVTSPS